MIAETDVTTSLASTENHKNDGDSKDLEIPKTENLDAVTSELQALRIQVTALSKALEEIAVIQSPLADVDRVADFFGKSPDTIRRWVKDRDRVTQTVPELSLVWRG